MSVSNRYGDTVYGADGEPMVTACGQRGPVRRCAYCEKEPSRMCDAPCETPGRGRWGRCAVLMCETHTTRVGQHHDLCREHAAAGDHLETIRRAETATKVWWERVETTAVPIPGTERPLSEDDRIPGVIDPDDEPA